LVVEWSHLSILGIILVFLGIILVFAGILGMILGKGVGEGAKVESGGLVVIGPIPIIFGTSATVALIAAIIGLVIMILAVILTLLLPRLLGG